MSYELPDINTMDDTTRVMNEYFNSLMQQGFTEHQALHIVMGQPCCQLTHEENGE